MSIAAKAILLRPVRLSDVAQIAAALLGNKHQLVEAEKCVYHAAEGYETIPASGKGITSGHLKINHVGYAKPMELYYNPEHNEGLYLSGGSSPRILALFVRLVSIYGGWVDFNDSDASDRDFTAAKSSRMTSYTYADTAPEDGEAWQSWQLMMSGLTPIANGTIDYWGRFSANPDMGRIRIYPDLVEPCSKPVQKESTVHKDHPRLAEAISRVEASITSQDGRTQASFEYILGFARLAAEDMRQDWETLENKRRRSKFLRKNVGKGG